jgi:hypothetical protein
MYDVSPSTRAVCPVERWTGSGVMPSSATCQDEEQESTENIILYEQSFMKH